MKKCVLMFLCLLLCTACTQKPVVEEETTIEPVGPATLTVRYAEEEDLSDETIQKCVLSDSEYSTSIIFTVDVPVTDLTLYSLLIEDVSEDGTLIGTRTSVYRLKQFNPDEPLLVTLTFAGDIPDTAVSYIDSDGTERDLGLAISGYDGSIGFVGLSVSAPLE